MRIVLQRVSQAAVHIEGQVTQRIEKGLLLLLGIEDSDNYEDIAWLVPKVLSMRIFPDDDGKMNLDIKEAEGAILVISQFTLHASTKKGNRPSFMKAASPVHAAPLYEAFVAALAQRLRLPVKTGMFGAYMRIELINDGPVTIILDSKNKE